MRLIGISLVVAGCQPGATAVLDASMPDGPRHSLGMFIDWNASPALPGPLSEKLTVSEATFQLSHFQVVGDAGPGDARTTRSRYLLTWDAHGTPPRDAFPDAPVGVYSKVTLGLTPGNLSGFAYQIEGTWENANHRGPGSNDEAFRIQDFQPLSATFDCDETLRAGDSIDVAIRVGLADALGGIDFASVPEVNDVRLLKFGDPQLAGFRDRLSHAFSFDD